ncbi:uncharacterized protein LOC108268770 isoform X1 [Ictalurus punctatus]|uniref:Uncharacterized protein LOC108268770 isoform X1 n=1 Tax=Ictalurus punctatus TaxID=7998 RepID=A0A979EZN8_ICTPU|nr:uncharacterized protein LOC108268770 isoform X1 [Ictalurus punctatus]
MTGLWISVLVFSTMCQSGRRWVTAQCPALDVYQSDEKLSVDIGNSATLQCCVFGIDDEEMIWFKQQNRKQPQIIVRFFKTARETFYSEFQNPRFRIKKHGNCFNMTISNTTMSDEAMYYCALVFADGTYLKIKGEHVTTASETSKPALCDKTLHGKGTNMNTQEKMVLGLGTALGLCALLIFCLIYFTLRRRKCDKSKCFCHQIIIISVVFILKNTNRYVSVFIVNASVEDSPGMRQESEAETLNYAALQFSKRKAKAEKKKSGSSDECVYSDVNRTVRCNINYS